ncbi:MAG TPA: glycosyltransferase, partial [Thermoleophilaceae bacterium]|nr:glycosyltransferase [Thermoleophilaceae bacterium]
MRADGLRLRLAPPDGPRPGRDGRLSRVLITAFGDPGHAFPAIALGRELAARGHEVCLETWDRWQEDVEREGMEFAPAPEYDVWPGKGLTPYQAAVRAAHETVALIDRFDPEVVVADILTVAGGLAAQMARRPWVTLVPHVYPVPEAGMAPYSSGARMPRTRVGRIWWSGFERALMRGAERGRDELNGARERVGLPPLDHTHGGISPTLALVATFPQLEYPRLDVPPAIRVTGPLLWERPAEPVELPPGDDPLVLIAPSTSQDPDQRMVRASLAGLAGQPVRVLATLNHRPSPVPLDVPDNARVVDWLSYARTMPRCAAVVCHSGHG